MIQNETFYSIPGTLTFAIHYDTLINSSLFILIVIIWKVLLLLSTETTIDIGITITLLDRACYQLQNIFPIGYTYSLMMTRVVLTICRKIELLNWKLPLSNYIIVIPVFVVVTVEINTRVYFPSIPLSNNVWMYP